MNNLIKNILLSPFNALWCLNPSLELKLMFRLQTGYKLNLKEPRTYSEKLQWLKLNYQNNLMPICSDKFRVREFVNKKGLGKYLNNLLWEGFNPELIPFKTLPDKFVIKATHGSSFNIIVKNKDCINEKKIIKTCKKWLRTKYLKCYGEWRYGKEKPRIIIERYLENSNENQLFDYKFYCFFGKVKLISLDYDRYISHKEVLYDENWSKIENCSLMKQNKSEEIRDFAKPKNFEIMLQIAETLSKDFLHARVDLYNIEGNIFFGEITFASGSGFDKIEPRSFDIKLGDYLSLPL